MECTRRIRNAHSFCIAKRHADIVGPPRAPSQAGVHAFNPADGCGVAAPTDGAIEEAGRSFLHLISSSLEDYDAVQQSKPGIHGDDTHTGPFSEGVLYLTAVEHALIGMKYIAVGDYTSPSYMPVLTGLPPACRHARKLFLNVLAHPTAPLFAALRRFLSPSGSVDQLFDVSDLIWLRVKAVFLAKSFLNDVADGRIQPAMLPRLREARRVCSRRDWKQAFGVPLPKHKHWQPVSLRRDALAVRAKRDGLHALTLAELLVLACPGVHESWNSPMSWFVQCAVHHSEILTTEGVSALAQYLRRRQQELGCACDPILEVGAGCGRLAFLLNQTGLLTSQVLASDVALLPTSDFPVSVADASQLVQSLRPSLVLCAWMTFGQDWTSSWRQAEVQEYLLIGDLGAGDEARCYSLSYEHPPYKRVLVEEVSQCLLHASDARHLPNDGGPKGVPGSLCAVAYRR